MLLNIFLDAATGTVPILGNIFDFFYKANKKNLDEGMGTLGFKQYLDPQIQGHIITSFLYPTDANFNFEECRKVSRPRRPVYFHRFAFSVL